MTTGWLLLTLLVLAVSQSVRGQNTTDNVERNSSRNMQRMHEILDNQHPLLQTLISRLGKSVSHVNGLGSLRLCQLAANVAIHEIFGYKYFLNIS